jgi:hypothetical protein
MGDGAMANFDALQTLAEQATLFGYPIVANYVSGIYSYALNPATQGYAPFNHVGIRTNLYTPEDRNWPAPNNDTLYFTVVFDLRHEPQVLHLPAVDDRYFVCQLLDFATNNVFYAGSRATGREARSFVIVPPSWNDLTQIPFGGVGGVVACPTWFPFILGRVEVRGQADVAAAAEVLKGISVEPLSRFLGRPAPPEPPPMEWVAPVNARTCPPAEFLDALARLLPYQIFHPAEEPLIASFAQIGLRPGQPYDWSALPEDARAAITAGVAEGRRQAVQGFATWGNVNGWLVPPDHIGRTADDYLQRAVIAWGGIWANNREEAFYTSTLVDADGAQLDGSAARYTLTFPEPPPVEFFWSVTIYERETMLLAANPLDRYQLGHGTPLAAGPDGSITLSIQHEPPADAPLSNWLPAPRVPFVLTMRLYGPGPAIVGGEWQPPAVQVAERNK